MRMSLVLAILLGFLSQGCVAGGQIPIKIIGLIFIAAGCGIIWYAHVLGKDSRKMYKPLEDEYQSVRIQNKTSRAMGYFMFYLAAAVLILAGIA